jgi:hypothetical protein
LTMKLVICFLVLLAVVTSAFNKPVGEFSHFF